MSYQEQEWSKWIGNIAIRRPENNHLLESNRGKEIVRVMLEENKRAFNFRRCDYDTFWADAQLFTFYKFDKNEVRFIMRTQMGLTHHDKHREERNAYAEMMRGFDKLKKLHFPEIFNPLTPAEEQQRLFDLEMHRNLTDKFENALYGDLIPWLNGDYDFQVRSLSGAVINENIDKK